MVDGAFLELVNDNTDASKNYEKMRAWDSFTEKFNEVPVL
jgi:hypothetical protein